MFLLFTIVNILIYILDSINAINTTIRSKYPIVNDDDEQWNNIVIERVVPAKAREAPQVQSNITLKYAIDLIEVRINTYCLNLIICSYITLSMKFLAHQLSLNNMPILKPLYNMKD